MGIYIAERRKTNGFENRPFPLQTKRIALQGGKEKRGLGDDGESYERERERERESKFRANLAYFGEKMKNIFHPAASPA